MVRLKQFKQPNKTLYKLHLAEVFLKRLFYMLRKYDFNRRRVHDLGTCGRSSWNGCRNFAICDNWGRKVKKLCISKTFTKSDAVSTGISV